MMFGRKLSTTALMHIPSVSLHPVVVNATTYLSGVQRTVMLIVTTASWNSGVAGTVFHEVDTTAAISSDRYQ